MVSIGLAVFLFGVLLAFNTNVFGGDDHGHDAHGHAQAPRPDAIGDWSPWSIVFRLGASLAACSFTTGATLFATDKSTAVLWMDRALLSGLALKGLVAGVVTMGILTAIQIAMHQADAFKR
jgi:hypothetical protein